MSIDPRSFGAPSAAPGDTPALSPSIIEGIIQGQTDLERRLGVVEGARTIIEPQTITAGSTGQLQIGSITAANITVGNVVASIMTVNAVDASHIDANSIRTSILNATQIISQGLQTQVLLAVQGAITDLSSINANTGTLTASLIRTDVSPNARVEIGTTAGGIKGYNSSNALTFGFDVTTGAATVGSITVTGANGTQVPASTLTGFVGGGNLLKDSSFESTDPTLDTVLAASVGVNWRTANGVVLAKSTTQAFHGTHALKVTSNGASQGFAAYWGGTAEEAVNLSALKGRPVVLSAWVFVPSATTTTLTGVGTSPDTVIAWNDGVTQTNSPVTMSSIPRDTWTRVVLKVAVSASATVIRPRIHNPFVSGDVYFDGIQLELGDAATAYNPKADEIIYGSITTLELAANAVKATNLDAGAITADKISLGVPASASIRNGNFNEGNPATGSTLANGWALQLGNAATIQTDTAWPRIARLVNATNIGSAMTQDVTLPLGRSILRLWIKATGVANSVPGTSGASLSVAAGTGTGTFGTATRITGTTGWTLVERDVTVTAVGTFAVRFRLDDAGTADFANFHSIPAVSGTTLTPTSIDAMTITGATFQTSASGARVVMDSTGLRFIDSAAATTVNLSSGTSGLALLASTTDLPPSSRKITYLHAAGGATSGEFYSLSNSSATPTFSNPSATVDLSGWTIVVSGSGSVTRDTTTFDSSPASFKFTGDPGGNARAYTTLTGTFKAGVTYRVPFSYNAASGVNPSVQITGDAPVVTITYATVNLTGAGAGWVRTYIEWTPQVDVVNPFLIVTSPAGAAPVSYFDTFGPVELMTRTTISAAYKSGGIDSAGIAAVATGAAGISAAALIIDDVGRSDFLQSASAAKAKRKVAYGQSTVVVSASVTGSLSSIPHGLGATPTIIVASAADQSFNAATDTFTSTTFRIVVRNVDGASTSGSVVVNWIAIG